MGAGDTPAHERVGEAFSPAAMLAARTSTFEAVRRIAGAISPGMTESQGGDLARTVLDEMGAERLWHSSMIRFGEGTLATSRTPPQPDRVLRDRDIFFVDLGVVWHGHEGDAGDTFVVGDDAEMHACAAAARTLWDEVHRRWCDERLTGQALYRYAHERAEQAGWRLNGEVKGHRLSDFPHAVYNAGRLGDLDVVPMTGLWVLEIQIAHRGRPFGAFYEDLLIREEP